MKPKVYGACRRFVDNGGDVSGIAIAEDGVVLASHVSSNDLWSLHDLSKHAKAYDEHYPTGYEFVWLGFDALPPEVEQRNRALTASP